uniref:T-complex protein 1 subunit eta n=1 Tax=Otolemur garnettii TaxID=30611 RepID=H0XV70_OTOGA
LTYKMMPTPVILSKEETDSSQGPQLVSNISACQVIAEALRDTSGPRGMDKLTVDKGGKATIANDGATILKLLDVVHPVAKTLVDIAKSQDTEVGDGTTSVTLLAAEFLKQVKPYVEEGLHPQIIIALPLAIKKIKEIAVTVKKIDKKLPKKLLEKCAVTALSSKLISQQTAFFAKMVVHVVMMLDDLLQLRITGMRELQGRALEDSHLVGGVAFKKTFSYAGFEMQPKKYDNPMIILLNVELELKADSAQQFMEEMVKSLHDAIMIYRKAIKDSVVAGGRNTEMELSKCLWDYSRTVPTGKQQLLIGAYTKALEIIPPQLHDDAGFDTTNIFNKMLARHAQGAWYGVDINNEDIADNFEAFVWEPAMVQINALTAALEVACLIVSIDEIIMNPSLTGHSPAAGQGEVVDAPFDRH